MPVFQKSIIILLKTKDKEKKLLKTARDNAERKELSPQKSMFRENILKK